MANAAVLSRVSRGRSRPQRSGSRARGRRSALSLAALALVALIAVSPAATATSNSVHDRELSLARQSLALGNPDEAIAIYRRILESDPEDQAAFWGLVEAYAAANVERERLIPLLTAWIVDHPDDFRARQELGGAHARIGDHERAHETWMEALRQGQPDAARYSDIGQLELRFQMLEQAVATYLEARRTFGMPQFFAEELVGAYTQLGEYTQALDECVTAVRQHSGIVQWAVNHVELMLDQGASRKDVERKTDEMARSDASSPSVLSFAGSVYIVLDLPGRALAAFLKADDTSSDEGRLLLDHASILDEAGFWSEAREAYLAVQERHAGSMNAAQAGVELGRGLVRQGKLEEALVVLRATGEHYSQHSEGGEALLAVAQIELNVLHEPDAAMATIDGLLSARRSRGKRLEEEAKLLRIDALLALGSFEGAHAAATTLLERTLNKSLEEKAVFSLGFSSFLAGDRRRALDEFREMIEADPSGRLVNDALRIMLVIAEAEEGLGPGPVSLLAEAHQAHLRGDEAAAIGRLEEVVRVGEGSAAATEALLLLGAVASQSGDHEAALGTYDRIRRESGSLSARAEALMRSGDIILGTFNRPEDAIEMYAAILEELPTNALSGEARRKIDAIRKGRSVGG